MSAARLSEIGRRLAAVRARLAAARARLAAEDGSAIVEFIGLAVVILIPLAYLILTFFHIQSAAFAAEGAARDAGRLMAAAREESVGRAAAAFATELAFDDAGLAEQPELGIECSASPCLTAGAVIEVRVSTEVALPLLPSGVADAIGARVPVEGRAVSVVDRWVER